MERALFDLSARTKLRLSGVDRVRYLNGQISNDLRKASAARALHACVLTAKGKINAEVFIVPEGESFLLDSDPGLAEALSARLERYIIADDVQVEDVTEAYALLHLLGDPGETLPSTALKVQANRFGATGLDLWLPRAERAAAVEKLASIFPLLDEAAAEEWRIERGRPRWGAELTDEIIPNEANLEASTIDYAKGCYIGQEVISRIKMSGQTNKRLCALQAAAGDSLGAGWKLWSGERETGWLTSVAASASAGQRRALGFVKRGFWEPGTRLEARAGETATTVEIVPLPPVAD